MPYNFSSNVIIYANILYSMIDGYCQKARFPHVIYGDLMEPSRRDTCIPTSLANSWPLIRT